MLSPQFEIQNTYQVRALTKMDSRLLTWLTNPKQTFQRTRSLFCKCHPKPSFLSEMFLTAVSKGLVPLYLFPSFMLLCVSWVLWLPPAVFQAVCAPLMKSSLSMSLLLFPLNFLCYLLCLLLFLLCHQKLTPYSLPISLCLSAHSSAS